MIQIPICRSCSKFYSTDNETCPYCSKNIQSIPKEFKHKITWLDNKISSSKENTLAKDIPKVTPPPVPQYINPIISESINQIDISISKTENTQTNPKKTIIFRRGIILVFEQVSFELLLQQPWIKKVLSNEIQICFERKFLTEEGIEHIIETILRLKIVYANMSNDNLETFFSDKTIHDEMAFKLTNAFIIVKDSPLTNDWFSFLSKGSNSKIIYYLSRNQLDSKHYNSYSLMDSELLFTSLIKRLLVIHDNIEIKISQKQVKTRITNLPKDIFTEPEYKRSYLTIESTSVNCMGHGGPVDEQYTCKICGGSLCSICRDSFLICPGSISTDLHKFESRNP